MGWFRKDNAVDLHRWNKFQVFLREAFMRIKNDIQNLLAWIQYFEARHNDMDERLARIERYAYMPQQEIGKLNERITWIQSNMPNPKHELEKLHMRLEQLEEADSGVSEEEMKLIVSQHHVVEEMAQKLYELERKLNAIETQKLAAPRRNLQEKIVKNVVRNSKEYIKNLISNLILKYENISGLQMKEMVVDEQGLCSKSSFYRILQEVERDGNIGFIREGKEKKYFAKFNKIKAEN